MRASGVAQRERASTLVLRIHLAGECFITQAVQIERCPTQQLGGSWRHTGMIDEMKLTVMMYTVDPACMSSGEAVNMQVEGRLGRSATAMSSL